ncbi:MAG: DNA translocase FtsK [Clostridia bacterium]|nr:DNA translocase FtsK [Clostridia bacterium]
MANKQKRKGQAAPVHTAGGRMAKIVFGLLCCALGIMLFLAATGFVPGQAFELLRGIVFGLSGALAWALPLLLIWLGALLMYSASRRAPFRPFFIVLLAFLLLEAFVIMITMVSELEIPLAMNLYNVATAGRSDNWWMTWWNMISVSYFYSMGGYGGGAIGMLLGYPLFRIGGNVVAAVLAGLLIVGCMLLLFRKALTRMTTAMMQQHEEKRQEAVLREQAMRQQQEAQWARQGRPATAPQPVENWQQPRTAAATPYGFAPVPEETRAPAASDGAGSGFFQRLFRGGQQQQEEQPVRRAVRRPEDSVFAPTQPQPAVTETAEEPPVRVTNRGRRRTPQAEDAPQPAAEGHEASEAPQAVLPVLHDPTTATGDRLVLTPAAEGQETLGQRQRRKAQEEQAQTPYVFPSIDLLAQPQPQTDNNPEEDMIRAQRLEETLASFHVEAKVRHITHGPAVTRFELEIPPGIKVSKVTSLGDNLAMRMEAKSIRIEAPIPGKSLIGVEVPNHAIATVTLREVLESAQMRGNSNPLTVALGRDIAGSPIICNLEKMPHLLIAGATGSGKSVCINAIINSLLYRCTPGQVRLILIDPKMVELQCYNGVPHLLLPVVSDPRKASAALEWAVEEMMGRYTKFKQVGVRGIDGYNTHLPEGEEPMPRIVIIIDELADLMMVCKRDVEERICRIAQLARAAGIHLVVATQRPSVDVITGLIKANIPSRIAFKVSSFTDSRTILDGSGADQLLGWGDMLYKPTGQFSSIRVQGCFLTDEEVNAVTDFIRQTCPAQYDPEIIDHLEHCDDEESTLPSPDSTPEGSGGTDMSLLAQCIEIAVEDGQVSTSMLQRRLRVGYSRAGRLVDEMEKRGIVSQQDGSKPRQCLISREEFEAMKSDGSL